MIQIFFSSVGEKAIIDEIQYAPELLSYVKIRIDQNTEKRTLYFYGLTAVPFNL